MPADEAEPGLNLRAVVAGVEDAAPENPDSLRSRRTIFLTG